MPLEYYAVLRRTMSSSMEIGSRTHSLQKYTSYLAVGTVVGVITVAIREGVGALLRGDTPFNYAVSVLIAYGCGIILSYVWQARFTFRQKGQPGMGRFSLFAILAVGSSLFTMLLSRLLRYEAGFDFLFGNFGAGLAFACAAVLVSIVSYSVAARYVFVSATVAAVEQKLHNGL